MARSEWREARLGDFIRLRKGVSYQGAYLDQPGPRLLGLGTVVPGGGIRLEGARPYSGPVKPWQFTTPGEMLVALTDITQDGRVLGSPALVPPSAEGLLAVTHHVARLEVTQPDQVDTRFLFYLLQAPEARDYMRGVATGTTVRAVSVADAEAYPAAFPPIAEQKAISRILGAIDDRIELNRRMSETLEATARALFKSWFIDLDRVRAKAKGSNLVAPQAVVDAIPNGFVDSDLGPIPNGWRVASIADIAEVVDCLHSTKPERRDVGLPLLQLWNIRNDGLIDLADPYLINEDDYAVWTSRIEARPGDCVITNVGRAGAVAQVPEGVQAALGRNMTGIRCKPEFGFPTFLLECLLSEAMRTEITGKLDTGTILDALNVRNIPTLRFVLPTLEVAATFERITRPVRRRMELTLAHSRTLAETRDALLPKLLSGEILAPQAERLLEATLV